jgi:hypothetical protein
MSQVLNLTSGLTTGLTQAVREAIQPTADVSEYMMVNSQLRFATLLI